MRHKNRKKSEDELNIFRDEKIVNAIDARVIARRLHVPIVTIVSMIRQGKLIATFHKNKFYVSPIAERIVRDEIARRKIGG